MTDFASIQWGGLSTPLPATADANLLRSADPFVFFALDYYAAMIQTHVGARITAEATQLAGEVTTIANRIPSSVGVMVPHDPAPWLKEYNEQLPLLAIMRKTTKYTDKTVNIRRSVTECDVIYVLPPVTSPEAERYIPILQAVARVIANRTEIGFDPSYTPPGGTLGQSPWAISGIDYADFKGESFGAYRDTDSDLYFPCWTGQLDVAELSTTVRTDFATLTRIDATVTDQFDGTTNDFTVTNYAITG